MLKFNVPKTLSPLYYLKIAATHTSILYFLFISFLSSIFIFYSIIYAPSFQAQDTVFCLLLSFLFLFGLWLFLALNFKDQIQQALKLSAIILSPLCILAFIIPYRYLAIPMEGKIYLWILFIIVFCQISFYVILKRKKIIFAKETNYLFLSLFFIVYIIIFSIINVQQYHNLAHFNPPDLALYNQIQWNNLHGRFFESSVSRSNFVTHNSPFLLLLTPLYALKPFPETLLILKTIFLALSVVPMYLITKTVVGENPVIPLVAGFMFYPFLIAQNFSAPHEICFAPVFILFSFYFFLTNKLKPFIVFLLICLSIKEHMALISLTYGLYALYQKRGWKWVVWPITLGLGWGFLSLVIIRHYQQIYHLDPHPAWFMENLKDIFIQTTDGSWCFSWSNLEKTNVSNLFKMGFLYQLISPLGLLFPLLSSVTFLGLPELFLNLLSNRLIFFPIWHYNIIVSCFLCLGTIFAIKKISHFKYFKSLGIDHVKSQLLLSFFFFFCILAHFFLWSDFAKIGQKPTSAKAVLEAISLIPPQASVTTSKRLAPYVSDRKNYFLLNDKRQGDYILLFANQKEYWPLHQEKSMYEEILNKEGVLLLKRKTPPQ